MLCWLVWITLSSHLFYSLICPSERNNCLITFHEYNLFWHKHRFYCPSSFLHSPGMWRYSGMYTNTIFFLPWNLNTAHVRKSVITFRKFGKAKRTFFFFQLARPSDHVITWSRDPVCVQVFSEDAPGSGLLRNVGRLVSRVPQLCLHLGAHPQSSPQRWNISPTVITAKLTSLSYCWWTVLEKVPRAHTRFSLRSDHLVWLWESAQFLGLH